MYFSIKTRLLALLIMALSINSFAQTTKPVITDDLLSDKDAVKAKFFPMANNKYLYKMYLMSPDTFIKKLNDFKAYYEPQINKGHDEALKELQRKDIEYYCRYMIHYDYIPAYGHDSVKTAEFTKFRASASGANYKQKVDSAYKNIFVKTLTAEEKTRLETVCWGSPDLDNTELFKRSSSYRNWLSDYYWFRVRAQKYASLPGRGGYLGDPAGMLVVINNEIKSTFIREYYASRMVSSVIKHDYKAEVKEKAYHDFMAVSTSAYYKGQVSAVYGNYKGMLAKAPAPDFTYPDISGQPVSLKSLRGKYVYIDVWATWCAPCKAGLPFLAKIEEDYKGKNIHFVSLSVDKMASKPAWSKYVKEHNLPGIQLMADSDFSSTFVRKFNINSIPRCIIIDPVGNIVTGTASDPANPDLRKQLDSLLSLNVSRSLKDLAASKNKDDKILLEQQLYKLLKSTHEDDWTSLPFYFRQLRKPATADSVMKAERTKFPEGLLVRDEQARPIYDEVNAAKQEVLYKNWIKRFPPEKFKTHKEQYEYVRSALSFAYARENNVKKAMEYAGTFEIYYYVGSEWARTADELLKNNHLVEAGLLFKKARDNAFKYKTTASNEKFATTAASGFVRFSNSLAEVYFKQKKYEEALRYAQEAHESPDNVKGYMFPYYARILVALGKNKEAFDLIDTAVKEGQATADMKEILKTVYVKVKGSRDGYDDYVASLNKVLADKKREEFAKDMIDLSAPDFTLTDVDGNSVSLASLKGKIVVLDFWAIWCVPCKASLPAMRLAQNKYKDDANVKFLFIHTYENHHKMQKVDDNPTLTAKKYITDNKYPFQVLMDLKDPVTGKNKVASSFKVTAVPTKFVIDRNGHIRFRLTGLPHGDDAGAEEVSAMIDLASLHSSQ